MATLSAYGANYTVASNPTPSTLIDDGLWQGKVRCLTDIVTVATAADAASLFYVGKLPKGASPLYTVFCTNETSTATGTIGYATSTAALGAITAMNTTKQQVVVPAVTQANRPLTADQDIYITTATTGTGAGNVFTVAIFYAIGG
jgi:hypothetical protein